MKSLPKNLECIGEIMSNFDHSIIANAADKLQKNKTYGRYPAWNFHGIVWYENNQFYCQINQYGIHVDTIKTDTLEEIMEKASEKYGAE